MTRPVGLFSNF
ncbi:UNVERIFIED_CONTAM: hypothetical protein GTU68_006005 [Idotea baltica]|nr:hypothetical protein [Idotea baltica]